MGRANSTYLDLVGRLMSNFTISCWAFVVFFIVALAIVAEPK